MATILCVDDDVLLLDTVVEVLRGRGHEVFGATDGRTAIERMRHREFDLALVDFHLAQGPNGLHVLRELRVRQPGCVRILMTGGREFPMVVDAVNQGEIARLLPKPFRAADVERILEEALAVGRHARAATVNRVTEEVDHRDFAECLDQDLLDMAVQPMVEVASGEPRALECLLRPRHSRLQNPTALLDAATNVGRIAELGQRVNELAATWLSRAPDQRIFVNVHPLQLADREVLRRFDALRGDPGRVVLEITERIDLFAVPEWQARMAELAGAGFTFALDDLGAGYSGLGLLSELGAEFVKLDMSIVRDVHLHPRKQRLVEMLAGYAEYASATLIAEGVETEDEAATLIAAGVPILQGYYLARPSLEWSPTAPRPWQGRAPFVH